MSESIAERMFNVAEAAGHLRISRAMLYRLAAEKKIRIAKIAGRSVVTGAELLRYIRKIDQASA